MRYFPVLLVLAAACHDPETERAPTPTATSAVTSATATVRGQPAPRPTAKPHDDEAESPLSGIGEGGGIMRSSDPGFDRFAHGNDPRKPTGATVRAGAFTVTGRLPPEVVKRIVRQNFGRLRACYQPLLIKKPEPK